MSIPHQVLEVVANGDCVLSRRCGAWTTKIRIDYNSSLIAHGIIQIYMVKVDMVRDEYGKGWTTLNTQLLQYSPSSEEMNDAKRLYDVIVEMLWPTNMPARA